MSLLDEIVFQPAAMSPLAPAWAPKSCSVGFGPKHSQRPIQALAPWLVCQTTPEQAGSRWVDLCTRLHQRGLVIECSVAALEKVPVHTIPRRLFRQTIQAPIDVENVHAADIIEITCQSPKSSAWGWPPEIEFVNNLNLWLTAVRRVIGQQTPLGIGVSDAIDDNSIREILNCEIDFVTLHHRGAVEFLVDAIARFRQQIASANSSLTLLVRTRTNSADHLLKIAALSAGAVTVDAHLSDLWQSPGSMSSFLGTRLPVGVSAPVVACPIAERLDRLQDQLQSALQLTESAGLRDLRKSMRALTPEAAKLARIPMLGGD